MKKKGLIISTVVMVVVLIASLTTATYAWFSSSAAAQVSSISMNVGAASKVQIGIGSGNSPTGYRNGDVISTTTGAWDMTKGTAGLGTGINTNLYMNVTAGVGSKADGSSTMDATYTPANPLYKASGNITSTEASEIAKLVVGDKAVINGNGVAAGTNGVVTDVVELPMGLRIVQNGVYGTYCKITVVPTDGQAFIGMAAALHFEISVTTKTATESEGTVTVTPNTAKTLKKNDIFDSLHFSDAVADTSITEDGKKCYVFYFVINEKQANAYDYGTSSSTLISEMNIKFFISGYDTDCNKDATGTGATISFDFETMDKADWAPTDGWKELVLE